MIVQFSFRARAVGIAPTHVASWAACA
jgi:hypothetical protein